MATGSPARATIGPYRITGFLGAGGMGMVWRAQHRVLGRDVAIKRLSDAACDGVPLERFRNEARLHATLNHPQIAQLYDFIEDDGSPCIVMEFVDGPTLEDELRRGPLPLDAAITLLARITDAVGYLHRRGVLHRDIKPSNVKLRPDRTPVLLDFGIARADGDPRLTRTGMIIGSPHAIAPEQFEGLPVDARADLWALGVLFHEMVTGEPPFTGATVAALASAIMHGPRVVPSQRVPSLPVAVDALVARCLERDRTRRFQSAEDLRAALRTLHGQPRAAGPLSRRLPGTITSRPVALLLTIAVPVVTGVAVLAARPGGDGGPSAPLPPDSARHGSLVLASDSMRRPPGALLTRISVVEGRAEVFIDDRRVGSTPYEHYAPVGTSVTLTLRRGGFHDEVVTFIVSDNQREYTLVLQRDPTAPVAPAFLGLLGWWRRRRPPLAAPRSAAATIAVPVTGERTLAPPALHFTAASRSDVGCVRTGNEDAVRIVSLADGALVAALCDGMGGHAAGEVAADLAVRAIERAAGTLDTGAALVAAIDVANAQIRQAIRRDSALAGMGTTCVVLRLHGQAALCAHVGDSRAYLLRDGGIYRLTEDHSHVRALVRDGTIADQEARHHPDKNVILRALGPAEHVSATTWAAPLALRDGDRFLLSSDGLHDLADDDEFLPALSLASPDAACEALVAFARGRGAPDNVSVCIVDVHVGGTPAGASAPTGVTA
ncbi:MAG: protein kinase [Gemmatimonadaceae bacterium]|nr:protein kinase [Gemmatimonadaceae bacterium]